MATIAVLGTLDTKGVEHQYLAECISLNGHQAHLIDIGVGADPQVPPYMTRQAVAATGGIDFEVFSGNRDQAQAAMSEAAPKALQMLMQRHKIDGVISLGGGSGTAIATAAMRALPLGFPKVMISTETAGKTSQFLGTKDIVMIPSVIDIQGLNRISKHILSKAAGAICGMVNASEHKIGPEDKPLILTSMFTHTKSCVSIARKPLENAGFEVLVFHASGTGGLTLESIVETGVASGVLDITTTEWADEVVGGILSAGPSRLDATAKTGTPSVVVPGCLDSVNFGSRASIPEKFAGRTFHELTPNATLMRTSPQECVEIGQRLASKINTFTGPVTVLLPLGGVSSLSVKDAPFYHPEADQALFNAIRSNLRKDIPLIEKNNSINDPDFAEACANALLDNINRASK